MKPKTLKLYLEETSKFGKHANRGHVFYESGPYDLYGGNFERVDMKQFVYNCRVRDMLITKSHLEDLRCMPKIFYMDKDITQKHLPILVQTLEKFFGTMNYTEERGMMEVGSITYLKENGVFVEEE